MATEEAKPKLELPPRLAMVMADPSLQRIFVAHLEDLREVKKFNFWKAVQIFKTAKTHHKRIEREQKIVERFLLKEAPQEIDLDPKLVRDVLHDFANPTGDVHLFDKLYEIVEEELEEKFAQELLTKDSVQLYLKQRGEEDTKEAKDAKETKDEPKKAVHKSHHHHKGEFHNNPEVLEGLYERWINYILKARIAQYPKLKVHYGRLFTDLRDGIILSNLIEVLSGRIIARWKDKNLTESDKIANVDVVIGNLQKSILVGVSAEAVVMGDEKSIMQLLWKIMLVYHFERPSARVEQLLGELLSFLNDCFPISNLHRTLYKDPTKLATLVNWLKPGSIPEGSLKSSPVSNLTIALVAAQKELGIPDLIDVADIIGDRDVTLGSDPDTTSLLIYLWFFKRYADQKKKASATLASSTPKKAADDSTAPATSSSPSRRSMQPSASSNALATGPSSEKKVAVRPSASALSLKIGAVKDAQSTSVTSGSVTQRDPRTKEKAKELLEKQRLVSAPSSRPKLRGGKDVAKLSTFTEEEAGDIGIVKEENELILENLAIRRRVFTSWANLYLSDRNIRLKDGRLGSGALADGVILANLVEVVSGKMLPRWKAQTQDRNDKIQNVNIVLTALRKTVNLEGITADAIVDSNSDITLTLMWRIIQTYHLDHPGQKFAFFRQDILRWLTTKEKLKVTNLTSDWSDNVALLPLLINSIHPNAIPIEKLTTDGIKNAWLAMDFAAQNWPCPPIISPEDFLSTSPDELSNALYLSFIQLAANDHRVEPPKEANPISPRALVEKLSTSKKTKARDPQSIVIQPEGINPAVRRAVMRRWVNLTLKRRSIKIPKNKFLASISAGDTLCHFLELISGRVLSTWNANPKTREQKLQNVEIVLTLLREHHSSINIAAEQIVPEDVKKVDDCEHDILNLLYHLYQTFVLKAPQKRYPNLRRDLLNWLNKKNIPVTNISTSFGANPENLMALVDTLPDGLNGFKATDCFKVWHDPDSGFDPLSIIWGAFDAAAERGIPRIVEERHLFDKEPDEIATFMYVALFALESPDDAIKEWSKIERDPKTFLPVQHGHLSPRLVEDAGNVGKTEAMKKSASSKNLAPSFSALVAPVSPRKEKDESEVPEGATKVDKASVDKKVTCVMEVPKDSRLTTDHTIKITVKADAPVAELHKKLTGSVRGPDKKRVRITLSGTSERTPGVARLSFTAEEPGEYTVAIYYNEIEIVNSPYALHIKPGKTGSDEGLRREPSSPVTSPRVLDDKEEEKKSSTSSVKHEEAKQRHRRYSNQRAEAIKKKKEAPAEKKSDS